MPFVCDRLPFNLRRDTRRLIQDCLNRYLEIEHTLLDIGCGTKPFTEFLKGRVAAHIGVDQKNGFYGEENVDLVGTAYEVPVETGYADAILSSQVIEHIEEPDKAFREFNRVLKQGGTLIVSFPLIHPIHAEPHDFFRYTEYGFRELCRRCGFQVLEVHKLMGFWHMAGVLIGKYLSPLRKSMVNKIHLVDLFVLLVQLGFYAMHALEGGLIRAMGKQPESFRNRWVLNYVVVARKVSGVVVEHA